MMSSSRSGCCNHLYLAHLLRTGKAMWWFRYTMFLAFLAKFFYDVSRVFSEFFSCEIFFNNLYLLWFCITSPWVYSSYEELPHWLHDTPMNSLGLFCTVIFQMTSVSSLWFQSVLLSAHIITIVGFLKL